MSSNVEKPNFSKKSVMKSAPFQNKPFDVTRYNQGNELKDGNDEDENDSFFSLENAKVENFVWKFGKNPAPLTSMRKDEYFVAMQHCKSRERTLEYNINKMKEDVAKMEQHLLAKKADWAKRFALLQEGVYKFHDTTIPDDIDENQLRAMKEAARKDLMSGKTN